MDDSLVKDRARGARLRRLFDDAGPGGGGGGDPSPLPAGRLEPAAERWRPAIRRSGTQWQGTKSHRHPSVPPVPLLRAKRAPVAPPLPPPSRARLRIDPRFRQRRIEVKREEGRRRLRVLIAGTTVLVVIVTGLGAVRSPLFAARHVRVSGAAHTPIAEVIAAGRLGGHPLMIDVHPGRIDAAIERLPWVARASARTSWPDAVEVAVVERTAVATIASALGPVLVDATGRVLGPAPAAAGVPPIAVDGGSPPVPAPLAPPAGADVAAVYAPGLAVAAALPTALIPSIIRIIVVPGRSVGLQLTGGASARLGDTSDLPSKLTAVLTLVERVRIGSSTIDATVPSAPVLTNG